MIEGLFDRENYQMAQVMMDKNLLKHQAIASNIANVETPGYKRIDLDPAFESRLSNIMKSGNTQAMQDFQHQLAVDHESPSIRPDGNNVKMETELLAMNRNALEYEFMTKYIGKSFGRIRSAITGQTSAQ